MLLDALPLPVLGLLLGIQHATEPDHVVAVTTMIAREPTLRRAVGLGAAWGLGHTLTVSVIGGLLVSFRPVVPPHLGLGLEFLVGLMLIALGVRNLWVLPGHAHSHRAPEASDSEQSEASHDHEHVAPPRTWRGAVLVGGVHGMAGSTAIALIVLMAVRETIWAFAYLAVFGLGTILGMTLMTLLMGYPMLLAARRSQVAHRWIAMATGAMGVALGCRLIWQIGLVDGLFTSHPNWTPQ